MPTSTRTTRLAPSPTGALHLGNARSFVINWLLARQNHWRIILRIEDLDGPRLKDGADAQAVDDLRWLGLDHDGQALYQRRDLSPYAAALDLLRQNHLIYPCTCTRKDIELAQSAPHAEDHELRYPGACRPRPGLNPPAGAEIAWRLIVPDAPVDFHDELRGRQTFNVQSDVGDFVVATKAGLPAYQLAVVVDDARQSVTDVVRGDDLLSSTARQLLLYRALGLAPAPRWWHLPLVLGPDARRLAKRHGDTRLASYRARRVPPERVLGLIAHWSGVTPRPEPISLADLLARFRPETIPLTPVTFRPEDHQWLLNE